MQKWDCMVRDQESNPEQHLPLTPAICHIMLTLVDGEKHGYAIMQEVERMTEGRMKLGPGTLYGVIKRLLGADLIAETDERPDPALDDSRRRYYELTGFGGRVLTAEIERLDYLVGVAREKELLGTTTPG
jgi:DNA-binding PadR family transcriptional regulator